MPDSLRIDKTLWEQIISHLEASLPEEGCGMVAGRGEQAQVVLPVENELHSPVRYRMAPAQQLETMLWIDAQGMELLAIFHSHPNGPEIPSETDIAEFAYPGTITLIFFRESGRWVGRGFRIQGRSWNEVDIAVVDVTI